VVTVRLPAVLRQYSNGEAVLEVEGTTVGEVLSALAVKFPELKAQLFAEDGVLRKFVNVYLNDEDIRYLGELATPVKEGDSIAILPAVAGGT
jgi:molybdopterin synthase sulfur carrier subunit